MEITKSMRYWAAMHKSAKQLGLKVPWTALPEFTIWAVGPEGREILQGLQDPDLIRLMADMRRVYS